MDQNRKLPAINVKNMDGQEVNTATIPHSGLMILIIWKSSTHESTSELTTFSALYDSWKQEIGVEIVAVSIDPIGDIGKVISFIKEKNWTLDFYFDPNQDFARAIGISNVPVLFLIDKDNNIQEMHYGFEQGDEIKTHDQLLKLYKEETEK
jgi:cytochrome c biogenesis protein CcmG, thiol:disulfide interchange protein DsbE